jgi:hypothetical protein
MQNELVATQKGASEFVKSNQNNQQRPCQVLRLIASHFLLYWFVIDTLFQSCNFPSFSLLIAFSFFPSIASPSRF